MLFFSSSFRADYVVVYADCRQKAILPPKGGRIALSANERIAEILDFAIQAKFAYVNKPPHPFGGADFLTDREKSARVSRALQILAEMGVHACAAFVKLV